MRALVLAAGEGRRLRPLTLHCPKPLLTVGGVSLIERHLVALGAAGITQIGINLHFLGARIERQLGSGAQLGLSIRYFREPQLLDTGGAIANAANWLGDEPFVLISADVFTDYSFGNLPELAAGSDAHLMVVANPPHNATGDFVLGDDGRLTRDGERRWTYASIAVVHPRLIAGEHRRIFPVRDSLFEAAAAGRLTGSQLGGVWSDVGTVARLQACRQLVGGAVGQGSA